ncbi:MAG: hypothetical protein AMR96_00220 [Candidatus Adiutrix intracellularis]|nr:MAG: hypothetical protein AMR96_00220 [Candidatus Adiutrix intracellularis]
MESIPPEILIGKIIILLALAVALIYIGLRLNMPTIVGFLVTGILVGPDGLGLINDPYQVEDLSEIGVVLLLFTIGLEFSIQSLIKIKRIVLLGGSLQMLLCILFVYPLALLLGFKWNTSLLFGFLFSLSSTAIVLKLLQEKGEMDSQHGRSILGVLIFQDLAVVPLVLILPFLVNQFDSKPLYLIIGKAVGILLLILIMAYNLVPLLFKRIAATKSQELFLFTVALVCLGTAFLTAKVGLSLALGAFISGLIISSSPYAYQAISSVIPMRDIFTSLFFVSIGMRMDIHHLTKHPFLTIGLTLGIMILNVLTTTGAMRIIGFNRRVSVLSGFALCQVGEFAFVLAKTGNELNLLVGDNMTIFLNAAVLTMALTPIALALGRKVALNLSELASPPSTLTPDSNLKINISNHAVVVGFGVIGQGVARACKVANQSYTVIEMNPQTVQYFQKQDEPIIYGDAVNETILEHVGLTKAAILVVSIPDPLATRRIIVQARALNPNIYILARTRFLLTQNILIKLGANEVVAEEHVAAIKIFDSVMKFYKVDENNRRLELEAAIKFGTTNFQQ